MKKQEGAFLGAFLSPLAALILQPVISSVVKGISRGGITRAERGYIDTFFLAPLHPLSKIEITNYFS